MENKTATDSGTVPAVVSSDLLAVLGEDGWMSPAAPPNSDRTVQIAWEDMSYGPNSLGFYDGIAEIPDSGRRFWWDSPPGRGFRQIKDATMVGAWRELSSANVEISHARRTTPDVER